MTLGVDVLTGLISSIVYDGIKRPARLVSEAANRQRTVNRTLNVGLTDTDEERQRVRPAIDDLVRSLGDRYTESVAKFLQELERSAIPDALKQFALCGKSPDAVFPAFDLVYNTYAPLPVDSDKLFAAFFSAIRIRLEQAVSDKGLMAMMKAQHAEISAKLDIMSACLGGASQLASPLLAEILADARGRIARGIELANRHVNVETTQGTKRLLITKLVINSRLSPVEMGRNIPLPHRDASGDEGKNIGYLPFRKTFTRALILGDPGGGKSTLTQLLCHGLANQVSLEASNPGHSSFDSRDLRLPLKIILRSLEKRQRTTASYSIFDYLIDEVKVYLDNDSALAARFLRQSLILGQVVLLFDGLDEILDVEARRAMVEKIEGFSNVYSTCPTLVTSRIVGYSDAPLNGDFQPYVLARFNKEEIRKFSEQLLRAVAGLKPVEAKARASLFLAQTEGVAEDLRQNPLLLGLMVYIFAIRGDVPNNRPEIYRECSLLMFEKWDQRRDIIFEFPQDFDLLDLFGFLARQIFGSAETEDGVSEEWLLGHLKRFFEAWYEDKARAIVAARALVNFITGRAWVMCEVGPHIFKFTHRTFLEYFFARRLEEEAGGISLLIEKQLFPKIIHSEWDVVSHLALQIATFRSGPKAQQACDAIMDLATRVQLDPKEELNFLYFVSRALDYIALPESKLGEIIRHVGNRAIYLGSTFSLDAIELVHEVLKSTRRRGDIAAQVLIELINYNINKGSPERRKFAMYLIGTRYAGHRSSRGRWNPEEGSLVWNTFSPLRDASKIRQQEMAFSNIDQARIYLYIYRELYLDLYEKYRLPLLVSARSDLRPSDISILLYMLLMEGVSASVRSRAPIGWAEMTPLEAAKIIDLIARDLTAASPDEVNRLTEEAGDGVTLLDEVMRYLYLATQRSRWSTREAAHLSTCFYCYLILMRSVPPQGYKLGGPRARNALKPWLGPPELMDELVRRFKDQPYGVEIARLAGRKSRGSQAAKLPGDVGAA